MHFAFIFDLRGRRWKRFIRATKVCYKQNFTGEKKITNEKIKKEMSEKNRKTLKNENLKKSWVLRIEKIVSWVRNRVKRSMKGMG